MKNVSEKIVEENKTQIKCPIHFSPPYVLRFPGQGNERRKRLLFVMLCTYFLIVVSCNQAWSAWHMRGAKGRIGVCWRNPNAFCSETSLVIVCEW